MIRTNLLINCLPANRHNFLFRESLGFVLPFVTNLLVLDCFAHHQQTNNYDTQQGMIQSSWRELYSFPLIQRI